MLDGMRRHIGWLKWSLAVVVLAFVFLYVPQFVDNPVVPGLPTQVLAKVGDHEITVSEFRQIYLQQLQAYRLQSSGEVTEELLRTLGIDRQILQGIIRRYVALSEAERLGLSVSDAEVRELIISLPAFQQDGQFIGEQSYQQLLRLQSPPLTTAQFENDVRSDIKLERLQAALTEWVAVSDEEIAEEHQRRNEKIKVDLVAFRGENYRDQIEVTDADTQLLYDQESDRYREPEKRKLRFLLIDESVIREGLNITDNEIQEYYEANITQYSTPGQIRASHILLRTADNDENEVQARATELVTQARTGVNFAELAKQYSEDAETSENGGDLGQFGRGRMVPEFETAAFDLDVNMISDPVKSIFGFHVIKVTEKQEESLQPLEEVRESIVETLEQERASTRASSLAESIANEVSTPDDLERAASARGLELQESGFAAPGEPILGLGLASTVSAQAFQMELGAVAGPISTPTGPAFVTVVERQEPFVPALEDISAQVREDVHRRKALTLALIKASEAASKLQEAENFMLAAEESNLTVETSMLITRGSPFPGIGTNVSVEAVAFELPVGGVSDVIETGTAGVVVHVTERQDVTPEELTEQEGSLRNELLQTRQNQFYDSYLDAAQERLPINIDNVLFDQTVGAI